MIKILLLAALIKLLLSTQNPALCAGIYAAVSTIMSVVFGVPIVPCLIVGVIGFGLAFLYFWLLKKFEDDFRFWIVMVVGLGIGLV